MAVAQDPIVASIILITAIAWVNFTPHAKNQQKILSPKEVTARHKILKKMKWNGLISSKIC